MFIKKIWKNRQSEHPSRRTITNVDTGETQIVEVQRAEGTISQEGDAFDENNMNDLEERIESAFNEIVEELGQQTTYEWNDSTATLTIRTK